MAAILLVDDHELVLQSVRMQLENAGHEVVVASHGGEGLNKLKTRDFDLVVSDILMPEVEGMEFIMAIRRYGYTMPIIVMTGGTDRWSQRDLTLEDEFLNAAVQLGAQKRIKKPFTARQLLELVEECVGPAKPSSP